MLELEFFAMVEDTFVIGVVAIEFSIFGLFERVLLVNAEVWYVLSSPAPVTGAWVDGENRIIGSEMKKLCYNCFNCRFLLVIFLCQSYQEIFVSGKIFFSLRYQECDINLWNHSKPAQL